MINDKERGFAALITVIVISVTTLAIATSISLLGIDEARSSLNMKKGREVLASSYGCLEEGMIRLKNDENYLGSLLQVGEVECSISVTGVGSERTIQIDAYLADGIPYSKNITAQVRRVGNSINLVNLIEE